MGTEGTDHGDDETKAGGGGTDAPIAAESGRKQGASAERRPESAEHGARSSKEPQESPQDAFRRWVADSSAQRAAGGDPPPLVEQTVLATLLERIDGLAGGAASKRDDWPPPAPPAMLMRRPSDVHAHVVAVSAQDPNAPAQPPQRKAHVITEVDEAIAALDDDAEVYVHRKADDEPVPVLMTVKDRELSLRESAWHEFVVPDELFLREMKVVIVFKGVFQQRGYVLGRLAAALYYVPDEQGMNPVGVGHAPPELCTACTLESFGRITIMHTPNEVSLPVRPGRYRVVLGAAARTSYSLLVSGHAIDTLNQTIEKRCAECVDIDNARPQLSQNITDLTASRRLGERKFRLVEGLVLEAEQMAADLQGRVDELNTKLQKDLGLTEQQERETEEAIGQAEIEFSGKVRLILLRRQEQADVMNGLLRMTELTRKMQQHNTQMIARLRLLRQHVPRVAERVLGEQAATACAQRIGSSWMSRSSRYGAGPAVASLLMTPAQKLRQQAHMPGARQHLSEMEQRWLAYDRVLHPEEYFEFSSDDESDEEDGEDPRDFDDSSEEDSDSDAGTGRHERRRSPRPPRPKKPAKPAIAVPYDREELEEIMGKTEAALCNDDVKIRKLLNRFHDRRPQDNAPDFGDRARKRLPEDRTADDWEFLRLDRILHPEWYEDRALNGELRGDPAWSGVDQVRFKSETGKMEVNNANDFSAIEASESLTEEEKAELQRKMRQQIRKRELEEDPNLVSEDRPPYTKEELMAIMAAQPEELRSDDQRRVHELLDKYKQPPLLELSAYDKRGGKASGIRFETIPPVVDIDIDKRCRSVLEELDLAYACRNPHMNSSVMHSVLQRFPVEVLRQDLERELDRLLVSQIKEREKTVQFGAGEEPEEVGDGDEDSDSELDLDDDTPDHLKRAQKASTTKKKGAPPKKKKGAKIVGKGYNVHVGGVHAKDLADGANKKSAEEKLRELGPAGCLACMAVPCKWEPCIDMDAIKDRQKVLYQEKEVLKLVPKETRLVETSVARSVVNGGAPLMRRTDLLFELDFELAECSRSLRLHDVDKELHLAYSTPEEYMETVALHGYKQMQWTKNVIVALERERNSIIAKIIAYDVVDDILEWMMEGWYFGERVSNFKAFGYVPSIKPGSPIGMRDAARVDEHGVLVRKPLEAEQGTPGDRLKDMLEASKQRQEEAKAVRSGTDQDHLLNETEQTLRFGIFSLTLMYFRAMTMLRREKHGWSGKDAELALMGKSAKREVTNERAKMEAEQKALEDRTAKLQRVNEIAAQGARRRKLREDKETATAAEKLRLVVRQRYSEKLASVKIQAVLRGHLGRLAAMKWAVKKAEMDAMRALQFAAAVAIQRVWRGVVGRGKAELQRIEMAEFIAEMRAAEAADEEAEYWRTHTLARWKRDMTTFFKKRVNKDTNKTARQIEMEAARAQEEEEKRLAEEEEEGDWADDFDDAAWEPEAAMELRQGT
eukprot:g929.t1